MVRHRWGHRQGWSSARRGEEHSVAHARAGHGGCVHTRRARVQQVRAAGRVVVLRKAGVGVRTPTAHNGGLLGVHTHQRRQKRLITGAAAGAARHTRRGALPRAPLHHRRRRRALTPPSGTSRTCRSRGRTSTWRPCCTRTRWARSWGSPTSPRAPWRRRGSRRTCTRLARGAGWGWTGGHGGRWGARRPGLRRRLGPGARWGRACRGPRRRRRQAGQAPARTRPRAHAPPRARTPRAAHWCTSTTPRCTHTRRPCTCTALWLAAVGRPAAGAGVGWRSRGAARAASACRRRRAAAAACARPRPPRRARRAVVDVQHPRGRSRGGRRAGRGCTGRAAHLGGSGGVAWA